MKHPERSWIAIIVGLILAISYLHYNTPTSVWQIHLIFMELYFIPILLAAFQFGVKGGVWSAVTVTIFYLPHVMLQWGGLIETNLLRFMQIVLFNVIGYLTGLKAQGEKEKAEKYKQLVHELEKMNEQQRIQAERLLELERELRASDRLAIIGEMTANLAHEVRNPLASIQGTIEILKEISSNDVKSSEFFDILLEETKRINTVVENYLSFAKRHQYVESKIDVNETINTLVKMLEGKARKCKIRFNLRPGQNLSIVHGDPYLMRQVLMNLLLNAMQAMPDGGTITITTEQTDSRIKISIADEGRGISKENLSKIFQPFFTTRQDGTGLGLSIVKRIVDENEWNIHVESEEGKGTTFELQIPLTR